MEKKLFLGRIRACIAKHKAKKKRQLLIKIRTLYQASYDFYLALYLIDVEKNKKVDLPAFLYLSGEVICKSAAEQAFDAVFENAISQGIKRINKCYKSYIKYRRAILRGC
ncbi:MAG: hypothetical protein IJD48_00615 [Clostridia bacterium]|nr:hypothetical protein [Clostridia bacterium]